MSRGRLSLLAIAAGLTLTSLAACSIAGTPVAAPVVMPPASQVMSVAETAAMNASSVHLKGAESAAGVSLDIQVNKSPASASGVITYHGQAVPVIFVDNIYYIQFKASLMSANGLDPSTAQGKLLLDKWVPSTSKIFAGNDPSSSFSEFTVYDTMISGLFSGETGPASRTGTGTVSGEPVTTYKLSDGSTAYIADSVPHYLLRATEAPASGKGELDFTGWNQPVPISKPSAAQIYHGPGS